MEHKSTLIKELIEDVRNAFYENPKAWKLLRGEIDVFMNRIEIRYKIERDDEKYNRDLKESRRTPEKPAENRPRIVSANCGENTHSPRERNKKVEHSHSKMRGRLQQNGPVYEQRGEEPCRAPRHNVGSRR